MHRKVKCPTLGPASPVKKILGTLGLRGRGIVGHVIDRCIIAIYKPASVIAYLADAILESMYQFTLLN